MKRMILTITVLFCIALMTACGSTQSIDNSSSAGNTVPSEAQQSMPQESNAANSKDKAVTDEDAADSEDKAVTDEEKIATDKETPVSENETAASETEEKTEDPGKDTIVVYFSATGTTKGVAERIASVTDADLFEIVPAQPYTSADLDWNDRNSRTTIEMDDPDVRPEIADDTVSFDGYSTVYIGYPIWWGDAPRIMSTFVEAHDFSGLTVIPFCTSGGSGIGRSGSSLASQAGSGNWLDGDRLDAGISEDEIREWIDTF